MHSVGPISVLAAASLPPGVLGFPAPATIIGNVTMSEYIDGPPNPDWVVVWAIDDPSLGDTDINSFGYGELACEFLPQGVLPILSGDIVVR
jgi:hypothetical protein